MTYQVMDAGEHAELLVAIREFDIVGARELAMARLGAAAR